MAQRFWALRCCSCRLFQVQQAKRSGKWSCSVCGQRQAVQKVYGQGSGLDCRHHVQKLNLLQGEAEEAIGWTSRCIEDSVNDRKNTAAQREDSSIQQEGRAEVSRWSKYLDEDSEDQADGEEEAGTERQQFCSRRKNTMEEQRKHQKSFLSSDVQGYAEENGVFQLAYQAKKRKKCVVAVHDQDDGDAVSGDSMVSAVCESVVPEENMQTPTACTEPSKWEKFLSCSDSYSENAARVTLSPQEGSGRLGLHSTTAADAGVASRCSEQAGRTLPPGRGFQFKKCVASTEQLASKLPGTMVPRTSCSVEEDMFFKEPQSQSIRAGSGGVETTAGRCCLASVRRANTLVNCNAGPKPSNISCEHLFCTGDEFDDDL
ncbi:MRN complex-interacting protein isoform X2 [Gymnogyps californianus]|uniref:MRN complex-interacting protein isoform X2 n=1 Tax=Gymnogyps californianus TaxID=33616 RepID=UPI0021CAD116|nr:MRN complex-interacting protein isoform X2 [Gymnogyps californianus]